MEIKKIVASSRNLLNSQKLLLLLNSIKKLSSIIIQYDYLKFNYTIKSWWLYEIQTISTNTNIKTCW